MEIVTRLSREWRNRMWMQTAFLVGFGLWFFYDGSITYPRHNGRFAEFEAARNRGEAAEWREFAARKGWAGQDHPKPYAPGDIETQFVLGALTAVAGLCAFGWYLVGRRQKLTSDGQVVCGVGGQRVPITAFVEVARKKWERKGIAYAIYEEDGKRRRLTIDDYKFVGGEGILKQIEEELGKKKPAEPA